MVYIKASTLDRATVSLSGTEYNRQNYDYISSIMRSTAAMWYGYPMDNGEQWRFELWNLATNTLLSSITYEAQDYCLYANVDEGPWIGMGCMGDPYQFYVIGTFYTKCLETTDYYIKTIHGDEVDGPFKPTEFTPGSPVIASLNDVTPSVPNSYHSLGTISGHSPGVVKVNVEVTDNEGCSQPLPGIKVELENTIMAQTGSHLHFTGSGNVGTGQYISSTPTWTSANTTKTSITAITDENGAVSASYEAGIYGVKEQVKATAYDAKNGTTRSSTGEYTIRVPGLVPLDTNGAYSFRGSYSTDCDQGHNDSQTSRRSHYVTPFTKAKIEELNAKYQALTGNPLCLNDASTEYGGFFDGGHPTDRGVKCHDSHRLGVDIDVNIQPNAPCTEALEKENVTYNEVVMKKDELLDELARNLKGWKAIESTLHYRFQK